MKLTTRYNRSIIPAVLLLFLLTIATSYFLVRRVLQNELDNIILRTRTRIENYVRINQRIPEITSFNDQQIHFEKENIATSDTDFRSSSQYIPEQAKYHVSRQESFPVMIHDQRYKVTISQPLEGTRHLTILLVEIAIATITITLLLLLWMNRRILSRVWGPFYQSLNTIRTFKVNNPVHPVFPESHIDEFSLMNAHFAKAAENASRDYRNLKEFSENASHEIQTPLAIMRSNLDLLTQEQMTERQSELLQSVYTSVRKLSRLQQSLLLLTKIDNRQFEPITSIRLDLAIEDKMRQFQEWMHSKQLHCSCDLRPSLIAANTELLDILLNNLFSNAMRYNIPNGEIHVRLRENQLSITNTGPDEALDPERIFRRFYKNAQHQDSNGLGLSIIKQICNSSNMELEYAFGNQRHSFIICWN